jgi:hypothetical protein
MYLRIDEAKQLAAEYKRSRGYTYTKTTDSILVEKAAFSEGKTFDVFLSHSYNDAEIILGVAKFIEDQGKSVYVDWIVDKELNRSSVNTKTADLLRTRMRASKSFVYASSENSPHSKWMPWELGFFDGLRPGMVSILPLVQSTDSEWKGQEYLGLYPVINRLERSNGIRSPFVVKKDLSALPLSNFGASTSYIWKDANGRAV